MGRFFAVILIVSILPSRPAEADDVHEKTEVYVEESKGAPYPLMGNLIYQFKEQLRSSTRLSVVDDPTKAEIVAHITGVAWDDSGNSMSFAIAWTGVERETKPTTLVFLHNTGGHVGLDRTRYLAESLAATTDETLDSWRAYKRNTAQSAYELICREPVKNAMQARCANLKAKIANMPH